ncbi:alpha-glucosidase [Clavulina sp. PMI_390]|nr:alpha-glucosidase [Clavulina sp. PMI_390]
MKFTDGQEHLRAGVKRSHAVDVQVVRILPETSTVCLTVASKLVKHRGDTLGGPLLDVTLSVPTEGVIGVKIEHRIEIDDRGPTTELFPDGPVTKYVANIAQTAGEVTIDAGSITAKVSTDQESYGIRFVTTSTGALLTASGNKSQAVVDAPYKWTVNSAANTSCVTTDPIGNPNPSAPPPFVKYVVNELQLTAGERIYGLGEHFGPMVKNGQVIAMWNQDGGTSSQQAYKCIPFYMSSRGYGIFVDERGEVEFEVGAERASRVSFSVPGASLQYYIIHGPTPLAILEKYTLMTGRPALPPTWTFGLWLSTSFTTNYDEETVRGFLEGMRKRDCDVRVFHFDPYWMKKWEWCSFAFDSDVFPNPSAYFASIKKEYGIKICLWINPYISSYSPIYTEGVKGGFFIKRASGKPWQWDTWQPGMSIVDFTNPEACAWYASKLEALLDLGVDTFKTDFGERIPHLDIAYHDGSNPAKMHNAYAFVYNKLVFGVLEKRFGKHEATVFARSAAAGGQRFPVHWGGDCESTFEAMAETLRGGLSLTASGFGFSSHDIGGFEGLPPAHIYMRWVAYGLFSSHSRLHGSSSYRVPWNYGEDASRVLAKFLDAKHRLMPYLYGEAIKAHTLGHPIQRAMFIDFPEDRNTAYLDRQFMFGSSLLVAPVFALDTEETEFYIPSGTWTSFWDPKDVICGPLWVRRKVTYDDLPVFVKEDSILPLGKAGMGRPDYDYTDGIDVRVYGLEKEASSATIKIPLGAGIKQAATLEATNKEGKVELVVSDGSLHGKWTLTVIQAGKTVRSIDCEGNKCVL